MVKANWKAVPEERVADALLRSQRCCEHGFSLRVWRKSSYQARGPPAPRPLGTWQRALAWGIRNKPYSVVEVSHAIPSFHPGAGGRRRHRLRAFPARAGARSARPQPQAAARSLLPRPRRRNRSGPQSTGRAACEHLLSSSTVRCCPPDSRSALQSFFDSAQKRPDTRVRVEGKLRRARHA